MYDLLNGYFLASACLMFTHTMQPFFWGGASKGSIKKKEKIPYCELCSEAQEDGDFIFVMAPVACMQKVRVPKGQGCMGRGPSTEGVPRISA